jgi:hypothetical protein
MSKRLTDDLGSNTMGLTWIDRIDSAATTADVIEIARVYCASITPNEYAQLPGKCRPRKLVDGNDLAEYAFDLVRETCRMEPEPSPLVSKMAAVMSHAANRISELVSAANAPTGDDTELL